MDHKYVCELVQKFEIAKLVVNKRKGTTSIVDELPEIDVIGNIPSF